MAVFAAFVLHAAQQEDGESARRQMVAQISDLERRLSRDVAASRDVDLLRAELHAANAKIDQLQTDDSLAQYEHLTSHSLLFTPSIATGMYCISHSVVSVTLPVCLSVCLFVCARNVKPV